MWSKTNPQLEEEVVSLDVFLYDENYLKLPKLSEVQYKFVEAMTDISPKGAKYTEGIACWGKGGGKDFVSAICIARIMYQLLCRKSPQVDYGKSEDFFIDAINVAVNAAQASHVFFQPFRNMINRSKIFRKLGFDDKLNEILFPKNLRAISGHSNQEGLEGYSPIIAILDEISAFPISDNISGSRIISIRDANVIYNAFRATVQSRFPGVGKIVCLSFPRYKGDFILNLVEKRVNDEKTFVSAKIPTWIANPTLKKKDFDDEYRKNPEIARGKYECDPPEAEEPYFRDRDIIENLFYRPFEKYQSGLEAFNNIVPEFGKKYCIHIDLALNRDSAGIAMAHCISGDKVVVDFAFGISPNGNEINFGEVRQYVFSLKNRGFNLEKVTLDRYASQDFLQILKSNKIKCEILSVDRNTAAYDTLKELLYGKRLIVNFYEEGLQEELLGLQLVRANRVDHIPGRKKDRGDAISGAVFNAVQYPLIRRTLEVGNVQALFDQNKKRRAGEVPFYTVPKRPKEACIFCGKIYGFTIVEDSKKRCDNCLVIQ